MKINKYNKKQKLKKINKQGKVYTNSQSKYN